ncbi:MAG: N-acetyl sugar amidotransferase [Cyclobacteriaceae bacterium]|nr:N-acetyl sugar amidotransferase [Cytophagales bacterium]MCZ8329033.1 N-acetyl sugar amidotransferase [Cyclobacteriaceae bacterium]
MKTYRMCTKTVMDTTDPDIVFDEVGICNYVHHFESKIKPVLEPNPNKQIALQNLLKEIKQAGKNHEYDCIVGLSGGVDSSYLIYYLKDVAGLRPLAVHLDGGWNSELAVKNIENLVSQLKVDLYTHVINWEEMKDLQVAFLKSGVPNQDVPQDHAIISILYKIARQKKIQYIISGHNLATESILPKAWGHDAMDLVHLQSIHKTFGKLKKLKTYPTLSFFEYYFVSRFIHKIQSIRFLNLIDYNKKEAMKLLEDKFNWRYYGGKHYESRFTKFFQSYLLPTRFGFDKRKAHLSSLIVSGQITRDEALTELAKPLYDTNELAEDKEYVAKKLGLSSKEMTEIIHLPLKTHVDYPSNEKVYNFVRKIYFLFKSFKTKANKEKKIEYILRF